MTIQLSSLLGEIERLSPYEIFGRVVAVQGLLVEIGGIPGTLSVGDHCRVIARGDRVVPCEVVGFRENRALLMPFGALDGVGLGCRVEVSRSRPIIHPTDGWLGRVVSAMGEAADGAGPLPHGDVAIPVRNAPPPAHARGRVAGKVDLGVKAMNAFTTMCRGQRMGIFAGSGVGKSSLMSMMARHADMDVNVIGLIGERGREAREFIEDDLGPEGMKKSIVVVATSDEPPLMRRQAAYLTLAIAEFFRDQGKQVLCLMDSVTRFAMAQREISLSAGEPPASKGYTPTVFAELPKLLERAGPGDRATGGAITGLFTVLVEGDDHNEPIADAVRGILDGHVVLDRAIAERGRYPAINVLRSISRTMPACNTEDEARVVARGRRLMATYDDMAELIRLGAYRQGSNPEVDEAIKYNGAIEDFLTQRKDDRKTLEDSYAELAGALDEPWGAGAAADETAPEKAQPNAKAQAKAKAQPNKKGG